MIQFKRVAVLSIACLLCACSSVYKPLVFDSQTSSYPTTTQVDPGGILRYNTDVNPRNFPIVLLLTNSNVRPANYEFTMRTVLSQLQETHVYNRDEFRRLAKDRDISIEADKLDPASVKKFSNSVAPVLVVESAYVFTGDARWRTVLRVIDGRSGDVLLVVDHPRMVWTDTAGETLYPVLNQFRRWYQDASHKSA